MTKTLVIAEKPSSAGDIARALGDMKHSKDFYENNDYVVSSAVGHLLEISVPEKFEVKRGKWSLVNLPVVPDYFDLLPIKAAADRLRVLQKLYRRADINAVVNACDAGREGELIFHNLMRYLNGEAGEGKKSSAKTAKPVQRLWLNSMTPTAIREGFKHLRKDAEMEFLRKAAVCRSEADWLVGINSTRAMTALHSARGGFFLTTVGRVQTPTLAILVEREQQIMDFKSRDYWMVSAQFKAAAGEYEGQWINLNAPKPKKSESKSENKPEQIFDEALARQIITDCQGQTAVAEESKKPQSEQSPLLFDLTSLQRECNVRYGMSARVTLAAAQALYERHKVITYPRTDSRMLPEDYPPVVQKTLRALSSNKRWGDFAQKILNKNWVVGKNKRIFNNAKVSDHFAIIPIGAPPKDSAKEWELKVYQLIVRRFLSVFYPPAKYEVTRRHTTCQSHVFLTRGKVVVDLGWREVEGAPKDALLAPIKPKETVAVQAIESEKKQTKPPPRYNEATLLSAMEGAGKFVEDEELREAMSERGIGTPATRAAIIEGLLRERYILRDGRELPPTPKAHSLIRLLRALKIEDLTLPAMTGEWEYKLRRIERADFNYEDFMEEIRALTNRIVSAAKACGEVDDVAGDYAILKNRCPACDGAIKESHRRYSCAQCDFFIWKAIAGREFSASEIETLLDEKETAKLEGFRSKLGREFSALVCLRKDKEGKWRAVFDFEQNNTASEEDMKEKEIIGACPKCQASVRDTETAFVCENKIAGKCDFGIGRRLLQREMQAPEIKQLLTGKTALLEGFISKKNRRPFKAYLTLDLSSKDGKLGFEFPPRSAATKSSSAKPKSQKPNKTKND